MKRFMSMFLLLMLSVLLISGCAELKKANSSLNPNDIQAMSQQVKDTAEPYVPAPFQPLLPIVATGLGYVICLVRQLYKDHMTEVAKLKSDAATKTS